MSDTNQVLWECDCNHVVPIGDGDVPEDTFVCPSCGKQYGVNDERGVKLPNGNYLQSGSLYDWCEKCEKRVHVRKHTQRELSTNVSIDGGKYENYAVGDTYLKETDSGFEEKTVAVQYTTCVHCDNTVSAEKVLKSYTDSEVTNNEHSSVHAWRELNE